MKTVSAKTLSGLLVLLLLCVSAAQAATNGKVVFSFSGGPDGGDPAGEIVFDHAGNAYGTTVVGGSFSCGTVFQLTPVAGGFQETVLYNFSCGFDGKNPYGGVTLDSSGNLYGTTVAGGSGGICAGDGCGTVYELTKSGSTWTESVLYNFTGGDDGFGPGGGLVFDKFGNLYGTTPDGGSGFNGVVYQLVPAGNGQWTQNVLHAFTGGSDGGVGSLGRLLLDSSGNLYGVTELGGAQQAGTAYRLSKSNGQVTFTTLYAFQGQPDAGSPYGGFALGPDGNLYGTTYFGGTSGNGTIFRLEPQHGFKETVVYSFNGGSDGASPTSTPAFDSHHNLYVTTSAGGNPSCDCGAVIEVSPSPGGVKETVLHGFLSTFDGGNPYYGLNPDAAGNLFSTTATAGVKGDGIIFSFTP